jgi:hypothetical protein
MNSGVVLSAATKFKKSLSERAFKRLMAKAGIDGGKIRDRNGAAGRSVSALSFHSLRHSFNSALANAGVSQELRVMPNQCTFVLSKSVSEHRPQRVTQDRGISSTVTPDAVNLSAARFHRQT